MAPPPEQKENTTKCQKYSDSEIKTFTSSTPEIIRISSSLSLLVPPVPPTDHDLLGKGGRFAATYADQLFCCHLGKDAVLFFDFLANVLCLTRTQSSVHGNHPCTVTRHFCFDSVQNKSGMHTHTRTHTHTHTDTHTHTHTHTFDCTSVKNYLGQFSFFNVRPKDGLCSFVSVWCFACVW